MSPVIPETLLPYFYVEFLTTTIAFFFFLVNLTGFVY